MHPYFIPKKHPLPKERARYLQEIYESMQREKKITTETIRTEAIRVKASRTETLRMKARQAAKWEKALRAEAERAETELAEAKRTEFLRTMALIIPIPNQNSSMLPNFWST